MNMEIAVGNGGLKVEIREESKSGRLETKEGTDFIEIEEILLPYKEQKINIKHFAILIALIANALFIVNTIYLWL